MNVNLRYFAGAGNSYKILSTSREEAQMIINTDVNKAKDVVQNILNGGITIMLLIIDKEGIL